LKHYETESFGIGLMSVLGDPDHEAFCKSYRAKLLAKEKRSKARINAYRETIYSGPPDVPDAKIESNARKFSNKPRIKARLLELADLDAKLAGIERAWLLVEAKDQLDRIKGADIVERTSELLSILDFIARVGGFSAPIKVAPTNPQGDGPAEMIVTDEQRAKALAALMAKTGLMIAAP
jgi:hypothetical protein